MLTCFFILCLTRGLLVLVLFVLVVCIIRKIRARCF